MNRRRCRPRLKSSPIGDCEEPDMAKFMDIHNGFVGVTEEIYELSVEAG
jgi:hypothetical protein